ncbi:MAG: class IV adenylate cyclase [Candidatus Thorarchaeota archaeon]|nr:class IV adenylate cyclase [Candidatus Thorarchaeota archaeon]
MNDSFEVEIKIPVHTHNITTMLTNLGLQPERIEHHEDHYFNHPCRDFAETDEALRLRHVRTEPPSALQGEGIARIELTYKGPKLDPLSKTRVEINSIISDKNGLIAIIEHLGFRDVAVVRKTRTIYHMNDVEVCVDVVEGLGTFVELESITASKDAIPAVRDHLFEIARMLHLDPVTMIRKSYLELIIEK